MNHKRFIIAVGTFIVSIMISLSMGSGCAGVDTIIKVKQGVLLKTAEIRSSIVAATTNKLEKSIDSLSAGEKLSRGNLNLGSSIVAYSYNF